jgi:hypothetical protein
MKNAYLLVVLVGKPEGNSPLGILRMILKLI